MPALGGFAGVLQKTEEQAPDRHAEPRGQPGTYCAPHASWGGVLDWRYPRQLLQGIELVTGPYGSRFGITAGYSGLAKKVFCQVLFVK